MKKLINFIVKSVVAIVALLFVIALFSIDEKDKETAQSKVNEICDELRIYNPMVSIVKIDVFDA